MIRNCRYSAMAQCAAACLLFIGFGLMPSLAENFPQASITNGQITAKIYLPDAKHGYYRSTRFDWSGQLYSLQYKGHNFYGPWYERVDPNVINWVFDGNEIVSGPCSALYGPVNEFAVPLGWDDSKPGGTFIKIGVGVLRRGEGRYNSYKPYDVLNPGKWTVKRHKDSIEFKQVLSDPASGYAYVYRKTIRLEKGKPDMVIEHSLRNTGKKTIVSSVYNHNFMVMDKQPPGPDFTFKVPFDIKPLRALDKNVVQVHGGEIVYQRPLSGKDQVAVLFEGFGKTASDFQIDIENKKIGAGVRIRGDRPIVRELLWSIRTVLAVEPYIAINVAPGAEFTWKDMLEYYTLPAAK